MEVINIIEHDDGSATYQFDMKPQEHDAMCRNGILWAIVCGVTGLTVEGALRDHLDSIKEIDDEIARGNDQADSCESAPDQV